MRLSFPNASRSFDESRSQVCFWGYDSTIEISFFVGVEALKQLYPEMENAESGFLQAFDAVLGRIHEVADKVYVRGAKGKGIYAYILAAEDF
ncbi:MAG: DUF1488 family protein [Gammaproteobacteria bacterium]|jgi:hypothetical protein|nr:DUF1488 family protein [Gammaproteobacteria bacterium]